MPAFRWGRHQLASVVEQERLAHAGARGQQRGVTCEVRLARPAARAAPRDGAPRPSGRWTPDRSAAARCRDRTRARRPARRRSTTRWSSSRVVEHRTRDTEAGGLDRGLAAGLRRRKSGSSGRGRRTPASETTRRDRHGPMRRRPNSPSSVFVPPTSPASSMRRDCNPKRAIMPMVSEPNDLSDAGRAVAISAAARRSAPLSRKVGTGAAGGATASAEVVRVRRSRGHPADGGGLADGRPLRAVVRQLEAERHGQLAFDFRIDASRRV